MISISKSKFLVLGFVLVAVLLIPVNDTFADHTEVTIGAVDGSGFSQACAESQGGPGCYTPVTATVDVGGVVTMTNTDPTGVHTFTSGTVNGFTPNPYGIFDSGILLSGESFEWTPENTVDSPIPYYCMLHTWMVGTIIVQEVAAAEAAEAEAADTTPPVITIPELTTDQWGNKNLELSMSGTTNFPTGSWTLDVTDNVGVADSACWLNDGMYGSSNPYISSSDSYDFSKITYDPNGKKFPVDSTSIDCAAYDAAGNRSQINFIVQVTHDDPTGFVQYIDKPNSFGNTADSTTKIFYSDGSAQALHLLKPIADLLTASNTQGMLARDATRTLMDGALTLDDNPNSFYTGGQYTVGNTGYSIGLPKPLADMLTDANMAGIADRVNPTRSWSGNGWSVEISEDVSWLSPLNAMVKTCNDQGSCQENHLMKPFADMLNESNLNQAMYERSNMKILDAGGPAASTTQSSSVDTTPPVITVPFNGLDPTFSVITSSPDILSNSTGEYFGAIAWDGTGVSFGNATNIPSPACIGNFSPQGYLNGPVWFPVGYTIVTCTASDEAGNVGINHFAVYVEIIDAPLNIEVPPDFTAYATNSTGQSYHRDYNDMLNNPVWSGIQPDAQWNSFNTGSGNHMTVTDINGNIVDERNGVLYLVSYDCTPSHDTLLPIGENTITCTATDNRGNSVSANYTINVILQSSDTAPPLVTPSITSSAFLNSTSSTGRTLSVDIGNWTDEVSASTDYNWQIFYIITNPDGLRVSESLDSRCSSSYLSDYENSVNCSDFYYDQWHIENGWDTTWIIEIPVSWEAGTYNITSITSPLSFGDWNRDPVVVGPYTTTVTVPVLNSVSEEPTSVTPNTITTVNESGFSLDCVETGCYTPSNITVDVGDLINMTNTDPTGVHTFTSGTVDGFAPNPSGTFDSGVLMSGDSFAWTPQTDVDQPYYCMLHTWMVGTIVVGDVDAADNAAAELAAEAAAAEEEIVNFTVEMTENGFSTNELQINAGDSVTFVNTHYVTDINVEPHAISDPFAVPYTEHSYYIIDDSTPERVYNFDSCESYVFYDRFFDVEPIVIECGDHAAEAEAAAADTTPPTLSQNQNITVDATTSNGAIVNYESPQVTDDNSGVDLGPTCTPSSGSFFTIGTTEVTCSASDWAGNVGTTIFTVTVQPQIAAPIEVTTDVSITIGKPQYNTDDAIFVTGIATPFTENNVSIQVADSLENVVLVEQITPESSGIYTGIIFPNFLWSTSGNYTMSATYGNSTANTSFGFEFLEPVTDEYVSPTGINLQTDTSVYVIGDTITIESALTDVGSDYQIGIFVEDPTGELRAMQFLNTDDSGSVSLSLKAQDNWIPGKYVVGAYDVLDNSATIRESVSFDLVKPIPEITISPTVTTTESGNTITSYDAGDMAYFETSLLSESTSDILVTINVVDADDITLGVAFFKSIVGKGDSELVLGFKIPEDASDGFAKIYVNTYTDWPDQGGIVIGSELLSEVNIEGVIIEVVEVVEEPVVEETVLPENTIPRLSSVSDIVQPASFTTGSVVSFSLPLATSGITILDTECTPAPGSMFPIGSTQVTCTATNDFGNTGMTSFMVTINPVVQTADQSLSVKVGKDSYNNLEPLFVTGSVGTATGEPINLEVRDTQNNLISIEQVTPKESGVYSTVLTSNELWGESGEYTIIAKYESVIAVDTFEFELIKVEEVISEQIPTGLFIDTLDSAYVLGSDVLIGVSLVDAGAGEPILLEIKDSQNDQVLIQSLNTDSDGVVVFTHQLDSSGEPGVYSVTAVSDEWSFSNSQNFVTVAQIPDITIGDVVSTLQDGTEVDSFESGDMGYFQTPVISESVSDVLITVNIFDFENTPLGLAYFNSKVVDDTFDITLGLQIPQDAAPGLATVYINTYTDWVSDGGVPILEEQVSFIEISPSSTTSLTVSSEESELTPEVELIPITGNISVNTESTSYTTGNAIVITGSIQNLSEYEQPVVILIVSPDGNLVTIDQVSHDSSGNYSTTVNAGGTMNSSGEYEVHAQYGVSKITSTFSFTSN